MLCYFGNTAASDARASSVICVQLHSLNWIGRPGAALSPSCKYHSWRLVECHLNPLLCKVAPQSSSEAVSEVLPSAVSDVPLTPSLCGIVPVLSRSRGLIFTAKGVTCMVVCVTLCC